MTITTLSLGKGPNKVHSNPLKGFGHKGHRNHPRPWETSRLGALADLACPTIGGHILEDPQPVVVMQDAASGLPNA